MNPTHHLPDALLLAYAAGSPSEGESLLVAVHASLCSLCARRIRELEAIGGALLYAEQASSPSDDLLARTLAQLDQPLAPGLSPASAGSHSGAERSGARAPGRARQGRDRVLPEPLLRITGPFDQIPWKRAWSNVFYLDLPLRHGAVPVRLRRLSGGTLIPPHTHRGTELELVLAGGATDDRDGRKYERGDVAVNDDADVHSLTIDRDEECVVLGVQDARLKPVGFWSRLVFGYLRW